MRRPLSSGRLNTPFTFWYRPDGVDGYGFPKPWSGPWTQAFTNYGDRRPVQGTELVIGGALQGRETVEIFMRNHPEIASRGVTTAWLIRDERTKRTWNIKSIQPDSDNVHVKIVSQTSVEKIP